MPLLVQEYISRRRPKWWGHADLLVEHVADAGEGGSVEQTVDVQRQRGVEVRDDARVTRLPAPRHRGHRGVRPITRESRGLVHCRVECTSRGSRRGWGRPSPRTGRRAGCRRSGGQCPSPRPSRSAKPQQGRHKCKGQDVSTPYRPSVACVRCAKARERRARACSSTMSLRNLMCVATMSKLYCDSSPDSCASPSQPCTPHTPRAHSVRGAIIISRG